MKVYKRLWNKLKDTYGKPIVIIINLAVFITINILYFVIIRQKWGISYANQEIFDFALRIFIAQVIVLFVLILYWRFIEIPKEIFIEMDKIINKFQNINRDANIQIHIFPRLKEGYASVRVINNEIEDIEDCILLLNEISKYENNEFINKTLEINPDNEYILQSVDNYRKGIIRGKTSTTYNLAHIEGDELFLLLNGEKKRKLDKGVYKIIMEFGGRIRGSNITRIKCQLYLEYKVEYFDLPVPHEGTTELFEMKKGVYLDIRDVEKATGEIKAYSLVTFLNPDANEQIRELLRRHIKNK
jgi:hypothetical protein